MPLYKHEQIDPETSLLVWKITESLEDLYHNVRLRDVCMARLSGMHSEQHQRGFLSVRMLLQEAGYSDFDMFYGEDGKPHLLNGKNISVTHSHGFSAIIISSRNTGIDMEMQREKIISLAEKFAIHELPYLDPAQPNAYMRGLTVIWGIKEALFKMISRQGMSFKGHMHVHAFSLEDGQGLASVNFQEICRDYAFNFDEFEGFTLVYTFEHEKQP